MKEKILVINDDEEIRLLAQMILHTKGYVTIEADNGRVGIEQAMQQKPDLILLDIMMPEMDGFATCQQLKNCEVTKDIPVIFFSSLTNPKDKIKGFELGGVDFVNNVVNQGELLARVHTHLQIQSLTRSLIESNEQLKRKQKSLDDDLHAAAMIQRSFLPSPSFEIPSLQLASMWWPAYLVGGDIFNIIQCGQDKVVFYMLDVSGHDVPSALVTISVSQYLQQQNTSSTTLLSPAQVLLYLDREYPLERFDRYFTIFYMVLDIHTGSLSYSSAGHPPAILLSKNNGIKPLEHGGTIIGLNREEPFVEGLEHLACGDKIVLYTDGVTERKNAADKLYGMERFYAVLEKMKDESVVAIVDAIQVSLQEFGEDLTLQDDASVMCFEFRRTSQGG